jgi:hypothetical protein
MSNRRETIEELEQSITDLEARLPKHSVPPSMLIELEDLEETLRRARSGEREAEQA